MIFLIGKAFHKTECYAYSFSSVQWRINCECDQLLNGPFSTDCLQWNAWCVKAMFMLVAERQNALFLINEVPRVSSVASVLGCYESTLCFCGIPATVIFNAGMSSTVFRDTQLNNFIHIELLKIQHGLVDVNPSSFCNITLFALTKYSHAIILNSLLKSDLFTNIPIFINDMD